MTPCTPGGTWVPTLSEKSVATMDRSKLLIITSDPEPKKQASTKALAFAVKSGAAKKTTSWFFTCIMKQTVELDAK
jgi:hypothetical protein